MQNQIYYANHAKMLLNPLVEGELRFGKVNSTGFECLLQKKGEKLSGWLSYTFARAIMNAKNDKISTIANRPHDFSIGTSYQPSKRCFLQAQWKYLSGKPITTPTGFYEYQGQMVPIYSTMFNDRLPVYHRLDITAQFRLNKKVDGRWSHMLSVSVQNVYARKNPISVTFNKTTEDSKYIIPADVLHKSEYISTILYAGTIMPTITYAITCK